MDFIAYRLIWVTKHQVNYLVYILDIFTFLDQRDYLIFEKAVG